VLGVNAAILGVLLLSTREMERRPRREMTDHHSPMTQRPAPRPDLFHVALFCHPPV
jgi:hypothetical protein